MLLRKKMSIPSWSLLAQISIMLLLSACSNSNSINDSDNEDVFKSENIESFDYLPLDDSEYPYAGIPRIVIETENFQEIRDRETEIPAKLQIWGESSPESEVMYLTIRGRGNTSWTDMPKNSYKIEFTNKHEMLGMPKDKDWALIANYADKTLLKNFITYKLASWLNAKYAPRCEFVELYLNKSYLGVYLLSETIKKGKNRILLDDSAFIAEFDIKQKKDDITISTESGKKFPYTIPKSLIKIKQMN